MDKSLSKLKLILTGDGSHSLYREDLNETYHSFHGARGESHHVFIENGIKASKKSPILVLEVGFGTGLNSFLTCQHAMQSNIMVDYHTIEPLPIGKELYMQLNFGETEDAQSLLQQLHQSGWGARVEINKVFFQSKYSVTLEEFQTDLLFDLIYFDAFAPSKQPEIWDRMNLKKCFDLLDDPGILVTYCAQGQFKRDLKDVGFEVETLKGAMGKKEMVRGIKKSK